MNKLIRYQGSKESFFHVFEPYILRSSATIYVEPFLGSGAIFLNLQKNYDRYILNDLEYGIIRIFKSFKEIEYNYFKEKLIFIDKQFGNIKNSKPSYYNFRKFFNEEYYLSNTIDEGIYLMFLYNSCINSMARFGPNGFNQGWGNCGYQYRYTHEQHKNIQQKLKNTTILNQDGHQTIMELKPDWKDTFMFIDPPYYTMPTSYKSVNKNYFDTLIELLSENNFEFIYTDADHSCLQTNKRILRTMTSTAPSSDKSQTNVESMWTNIKLKTLF